MTGKECVLEWNDRQDSLIVPLSAHQTFVQEAGSEDDNDPLVLGSNIVSNDEGTAASDQTHPNSHAWEANWQDTQQDTLVGTAARVSEGTAPKARASERARASELSLIHI